MPIHVGSPPMLADAEPTPPVGNLGVSVALSIHEIITARSRWLSIPPLLGDAPPAVGDAVISYMGVSVVGCVREEPLHPQPQIIGDRILIVTPPMYSPAVSHLGIRQPVSIDMRRRDERKQITWGGVASFQSGPRGTRVDMVRRYSEARGAYRIFNADEYRFYYSDTAPPSEGDTPDATSEALPFETADTFADGTWYLSISYFNGCMDSGFYPVGPGGETYLRLDIQSGVEVGLPPNEPIDWRLEQRASGVVRVLGEYIQEGDLRANEWAIGFDTGAGEPPPDTPDYTVSIPGSGLAILEYDLPAQDDETTVNVILQTRRNDGTAESPNWVYSENDTIKSIDADASGPSGPLWGEHWTGA